MRSLPNAYLFVCMTLGLAACGGGGSASLVAPSSSRTPVAFPTDLLVVSPTDTSQINSRSVDTSGESAAARATYTSTQENINRLLRGSASLQSLFAPTMLYQTTTDASCYGPAMLYQNHPDGGRINSGELPEGDLGIWQETDATSGDACAAAQLNSRMQGIRDRTTAGLMMMAGMIDRIYSKGSAFPDSGQYIDLTSDMNALNIPGLTFEFMLLGKDVSGMWNYDVDFTYKRNGKSYKAKLQATHNPDSNSTYNGLIAYQIQDTTAAGGCPSSNITHQGSVAYAKNTSGNMQVEAREADFCGHDGTTNSYIAGSVLNPADKYDSVMNLDGWGNNYQQMTAEYDPANLSGQYAYVWQAGPNDSHSRVFNVTIKDTEPMEGEAWFGFGVPVDNPMGTGRVGQITGFVCNWAGPGSSQVEQEYAQHQYFRYDNTSDKFEAVSDESDITYAPTNSCMYDGSGSFQYDRNLNGILDDSNTDIAIVKEMPSYSNELPFDMFPASSSLYAGSDVEDAIPALGYIAPTPPISPLP